MIAGFESAGAARDSAVGPASSFATARRNARRAIKREARRAAVEAWVRAARVAKKAGAKSTAAHAWQTALDLAAAYGPQGCQYARLTSALGHNHKLVRITRHGRAGAYYGRVVYRPGGTRREGTERGLRSIGLLR